MSDRGDTWVAESGSTVTDVGDGILVTNDWDEDHQHLAVTDPTEWAWKVGSDSQMLCRCQPGCLHYWHWGEVGAKHPSAEAAKCVALAEKGNG